MVGTRAARGNPGGFLLRAGWGLWGAGVIHGAIALEQRGLFRFLQLQGQAEGGVAAGIVHVHVGAVVHQVTGQAQMAAYQANGGAER